MQAFAAEAQSRYAALTNQTPAADVSVEPLAAALLLPSSRVRAVSGWPIAFACYPGGGRADQEHACEGRCKADSKHDEGVNILSRLDALVICEPEQAICAAPSFIRDPVENTMAHRRAIEHLDEERAGHGSDAQLDDNDPDSRDDPSSTLHAIPMAPRFVGGTSGARLATLITPYARIPAPVMMCALDSRYLRSRANSS